MRRRSLGGGPALLPLEFLFLLLLFLLGLESLLLPLDHLLPDVQQGDPVPVQQGQTPQVTFAQQRQFLVQSQPQPVGKQPHHRQQERIVQGPKLKERKEEVVELGVGGRGKEKGAGVHLLQGVPELAGVDDPVDPRLLQLVHGGDAKLEREEVVQTLGVEGGQVPVDLAAFPEGLGQQVAEEVAFEPHFLEVGEAGDFSTALGLGLALPLLLLLVGLGAGGILLGVPAANLSLLRGKRRVGAVRVEDGAAVRAAGGREVLLLLSARTHA